jgi:hypothetical protein
MSTMSDYLEKRLRTEFFPALNSLGFMWDRRLDKGAFFVRGPFGIHFSWNKKGSINLNLFLNESTTDSGPEVWVRASFGAVANSLYIWAVYDELICNEAEASRLRLTRGGSNDILAVGRKALSLRSFERLVASHKRLLITMFSGSVSEDNLKQAIRFAAWT